MYFLLLPIQITAVILIADFVAGIVHWIQDAYIRADTPLLGAIGKANTLHHHNPRYFTQFNWWYTSWQLVVLVVVIVTVAYFCGFLTWQLGFFALISVNANQIHKLSHRTVKENGRIITFLQRTRLILTPRHHLLHHKSPKLIRYCPITDFLNPCLDRMHFWNRLEMLLFYSFGLKRREDTSVTL